MAKNEDAPNNKPIEEMSEEELRKEVLRVDLQTKMLLLDKTRKELVDYEQKERKRREQNKTRMAELEAERNTRERITKICRHRSGGTPKNILKGKGVGSFSLITRTLMPDGFTILLQCVRCRLKKFTPKPPAKDASSPVMKQYLKDAEEFQKLLNDSIEEGLEYAEMRGPTFTFFKDGQPFIPDRV